MSWRCGEFTEILVCNNKKNLKAFFKYIYIKKFSSIFLSQRLCAWANCTFLRPNKIIINTFQQTDGQVKSLSSNWHHSTLSSFHICTYDLPNRNNISLNRMGHCKPRIECESNPQGIVLTLPTRKLKSLSQNSADSYWNSRSKDIHTTKWNLYPVYFLLYFKVQPEAAKITRGGTTRRRCKYRCMWPKKLKDMMKNVLL